MPDLSLIIILGIGTSHTPLCLSELRWTRLLLAFLGIAAASLLPVTRIACSTRMVFGRVRSSSAQPSSKPQGEGEGVGQPGSLGHLCYIQGCTYKFGLHCCRCGDRSWSHRQLCTEGAGSLVPLLLLPMAMGAAAQGGQGHGCHLLRFPGLGNQLPHPEGGITRMSNGFLVPPPLLGPCTDVWNSPASWWAEQRHLVKIK